MTLRFLFFCRCVAGMAEKLREAAARGDVARVARLLDEDIKPLPDEVSLFSYHSSLYRPPPCFLNDPPIFSTEICPLKTVSLFLQTVIRFLGNVVVVLFNQFI